ncbi:LysR family transcriptional regulator [Acetobacteraceae bacterium KSS8]|uniref:LysR family transcriptional regulator n=1 Tax=Endosaccharibacter trunci TaxID=2812733 RepID=A0ABT1W7L6_9PROT|nr:LysR family transcriptional regulator [Acetobacteraceae bacterium KSS8]
MRFPPAPSGPAAHPPDAVLPRRPQRAAVNLSIDLLRSFVAIVDMGSISQATDRIFLTQSALSLQMKRLEDQLRQRLFDRQGRALKLTPAGEELAAQARRLLALNDDIVASLGIGGGTAPIRFGMVQDFAETVLPVLLPVFRTRQPEARLQLRIGGSAELGELFDRSRLEMALVYGRPPMPRLGSVTPMGVESMSWIGDPALAQEAVLPLVVLDEPCAFRSALLDTLERSERAYRIVLETPHLPGLTASLRAGFGLTCRTTAYAAFHDLPVPPCDLPSLPVIERALLCRDRLQPAAESLSVLLRQLSPQPSGNLVEDGAFDS